MKRFVRLSSLVSQPKSVPALPANLFVPSTGTSKRFSSTGLAGLTAAAYPTPSRTVPPAVRTLIVELHAEYPAFNRNELRRICHTQTGYRPSSQTVKRILAESPPPPKRQRRYPLFHAMSERGRRIAVIHLHVEGWPSKSIAGYLKVSSRTVHRLVKRWKTEELAALIPHSRAPKRRVRKVTLKTMLAVQALRKNPGLGAFRLRAALKQKYGIKLSTRTCARLLATQRRLDQSPHHPVDPATPLPMPFAARRVHEYWSVDIRYLDMHTLGGGMIYCISIFDNYSRAILASAISRTQDLTAYLLVLFMAIRNHGAPDMLVSDGGAVFRAKRAQAIYLALGMLKCQIDKGEPWQNFAETTFSI